jgi:hypothetical protein
MHRNRLMMNGWSLHPVNLLLVREDDEGQQSIAAIVFVSNH